MSSYFRPLNFLSLVVFFALVFNGSIYVTRVGIFAAEDIDVLEEEFDNEFEVVLPRSVCPSVPGAGTGASAGAGVVCNRKGFGLKLALSLETVVFTLLVCANDNDGGLTVVDGTLTVVCDGRGG